MKINEFLQADIDLFHNECNFTEVESTIFEYKRIPLTDIQIADKLDMTVSNVQAIMRKIRRKIDDVLKQSTRNNDRSLDSSCCKCVVSHTMSEWSKIPDFISSKGTLYIFSDYRTENNVNIPRIKIGDGVSSLTELPFATMSITDGDMEYWDNKPDLEENNFGKVIVIDKSYNKDNKFTFPSDGYLMLEFEDSNNEHAVVYIYGAKGETGFEFSKYTDRDSQSKEVFVRKGMKCEYVSASETAIIKFVPLI